MKKYLLLILVITLIPIKISNSIIYFITGNKNKFNEVKKILPEVEQLDIDLTEIQETDAEAVVKAKVQEAFTKHQGPFLIEDTSLYLDALGGLPGPLIKWFMKPVGNYGLFNRSL